MQVVLTGFGLASTGEGKAMVSFLPQSLVSLTQVCIVTPPPLYRLVTLVTDGFAFASRQRKVPF